MRLLSLFILIGYLGLLLVWMGRTPAYNGDLRVQAANGNTILDYTPAMYSQAEYLLEVGHGYVFPDIAQLIGNQTLETASDLPLPSVEEVQLNAQKGVQFLEQSLVIASVDARTWMALAWGHALADGTPEQSLSALRQSWKFAPHDRGLADRRLSLVALMVAQDPQFEMSLTDADLQGISADKATLAKYDPRSLNRISNRAASDLFLN